MGAAVLPIGPRTAEAGEAIHPTVIVLDLSQARDDVQFGVAGSIFYAVDANDDLSTFDLKFDEQNRQGIPILKGTKFAFKKKFQKLFISNAAQPGKTLTFIVAGPDTFDIDIRQLLAVQAIISPVKSNVIIAAQTQNNQVSVSPSSSTLLRSVPAGKIEEIRLFGRDAFNFFVAFGATADTMSYLIPPGEERIFVVLGPMDVNARADVTAESVRVLAVPLN